MSTTSVQQPSSHIVNNDDTTSIVPGNDHSTMVEQSNSNEEDITVNNNKTTSTTKKRTRATAEQLAVLEDTFAVNVSPNSKLRKQLAERLQMSERSIQIWFQNRRAKVKHMQKRAQMQMQQASIRAQLYHYHQQQYGAHPYGNHHHPHHQQHHHPHHHQQQQQHHGPPLMPLQPHQQQQHYYRPQQQAYPTPSSARVPLPRAQSVDTIQQHNPVQLPTSTATPPPSHLYYPPTHPHQQWSENTPVESSPTSITTSTHPYNNSTIPTLVPVPDAGPTAMLTTSDFNYGPSTPAATPPAPSTMTNDLWCAPDAFDRAQSCSLAVSDPTMGELVSPVRALSDPIVTTIDPSSLMMTPPATSASSSTTTSSSSESSQASQSAEQQQSQLLDDKNTTININNNNNNNNNNTSLNATTLTIGSWHRLKLRANDLLCVYQPERRMFAWHIADAGSLFRMEISLDAVASIEYIAGECDVLADVHFDISESPQFYMMQQQQQQQQNNKDEVSTKEEQWVQCSDFTENKQASRFFRHSLKGVAHHMKQELLNLMEKHDETRRLVRFIETPIPTALTAAYQPNMIVEDTMFNPHTAASSYMYWNQMANTPFMAEPCSFLS
ncbi:hypothetical protein INT45_004170 [Circinella minor]|uniref:Homeobox domain-containing protein n=1 Tax=Circinella minor TaxID=1195481 RepID=A0A8H7RVJ5_9FUNG|nr:hypothetical protein INT45_004170 [Circinella minor]